MKKKIILYSFVALIAVFSFLYFNIINDKPSGYDTSQQGISEIKGGFVPEQKTDYIFITVEEEFKIAVVGLLIITAVIVILVRKKSRRTKSDS
jgi:hypothetical protein